MAVHNATARRWGETFYFGSLDGETWLPISRPLKPGEEQDLQALLDGDGKFLPMRWARRALHYSFEVPEDGEVEFHA